MLAGLNWQICLIYLDDIIVHGRTFDSMVANLENAFSRLQDAGLKLKPRKCQLFCKEVEYLGHIISATGIRTDPKKIDAVKQWPTPRNLTELRSFVGLCSYYRKFIKGFANIAKPLHKLTEKSQTFKWTDECERAFETLKQKLIESPTMAHPDFSKPFVLDTDASDLGIGAVLSQNIDGQERVIAYASRTLSKSERRYCVTRKELLALVNFVKYFRHYLYGKQFTVRTDHASLRWLMNFRNPEGQVARWIEILSGYDIKIEHRAGRTHQNADGLSRIPCRQCGLSAEAPTDGEIFVVNQLSTDREDMSVLDLESIQNENTEIRFIKEKINRGERPDLHEVASESWFLKSLLNQWKMLEVKGGLLTRRWVVLGSDIVIWQAVVPPSHRRQVLRYSHDIMQVAI